MAKVTVKVTEEILLELAKIYARRAIPAQAAKVEARLYASGPTCDGPLRSPSSAYIEVELEIDLTDSGGGK